MIPAGHHLWRLSKAGDDSLGLCCTEDGLSLGRTPLVERRNGAYIARSQGDLERLLGRGYGAEIALDGVMPGLAFVASALGEENLCLAQIASVQLRLSDLPDLAARLRMETEDLLIKAERSDAQFARAAWEEAQHPRTGTSPNPGRFAPRDNSSGGPLPTPVAQNDREEREPEEVLDPLGPARQALWDAASARLRRIDPNNPNLTYFANPRSNPSQEALDRLNATVEAAAIKRVTDKVMPDGQPIGWRGNDPSVRELPGELQAAKDLFDYLAVGGNVRLANDKITVVELPGKAGFVTLRPVSDSGSPALDINVPGVIFDKIHFP